MALTTRQSQQTRLGNRENSDAVAPGKAGLLGKTRLTTATARSALGNIGNRAAFHTAQDAKKGVKQEPSKEIAKPRLNKTAAVTSLQNAKDTKKAVTKPVKPQNVEEIKKEAPAPFSPMEVSASEAFSRLMLPPNVADIDSEDHDNPQLVAEYVNDIYTYMRQLEDRYSINEHYLDGRGVSGQSVTGRMRGILIDWLVQVHLRFHLLQETLYLTVAIIDRFLQNQDVARSKLQLVGVTSMLIASKYEEMYAPEIADFVYITDNAYSKSDIRKMECIILKMLDFQLGRPLPLHFLRRNSKAGDVDASKHTLAKYLMELCIVDYELAHTPPSQIAAASLCCSMKVLGSEEWSDTLSHYSKYPESQLKPIMKRMAMLVQKADSGKLTAIHTKYSSSKFMRTSRMPELQSQVITDLASS